MRKTIILFFILSSFLLANVGKVVAFKGKAEIIRDGKAIDVNKNTIFYKKDILTTKKNTKLQILFNDETIITVGQNSVFKINNYIFDNLNSKAEFSMTKGVFRTITGKIGKIVPKNFKLKTKTASIGIRGTQIVTQIDENIEKIFCTEGKIEITNIITNASVEVFKGEFIEILKERTNEPLEVRKIKKNDIKNINQNLTIEKNLANDSISVIKKDPVANNKITIKETQELNKDKLIIDNKPINSEESQRNTEVITSQETDVNTLEDENTNIVSNSQNNSVTDDSNNSEDTAYTSDTVEDVVADVSDTTENELENNADTVEEVVENTTDTITENNSEDTPAITDNTTDTVEDVVADVSDTTENLVENVADTTNDDSILGGILDIFTDDETTDNNVEDNTDTVEEVVENTTDTITENNSEDTPAITDNTTDTVEDVVADVSDTTENIVENVADTITEDNSVTNNTTDTVEDVVTDVSDTTENIVENVTETTNDDSILGGILDIFTDDETTDNNVEDNTDTVEEVVENTTDTITENNSEDTPAITDNTTDTVEDVVADVSDTTENIVENVADTITEDNSVTNNTTDTVEDVVADVSDTTNDDSILGGILDIFTDDDNDDSSNNNTNEEDILLSDVINSIDNITSSSYLYNTTANASYNGNFNNHEFNTGSQYLKDINKNKVDIPEDTTISMDIDFGANFNQLTNGKININDVGDGTSRELNFEGSADKFFSTISFSPSNTTKGAGGSGTFYGDEAELIKGSLNMKSSDNIQIKGNFDAVKK